MPHPSEASPRRYFARSSPPRPSPSAVAPVAAEPQTSDASGWQVYGPRRGFNRSRGRGRAGRSGRAGRNGWSKQISLAMTLHPSSHLLASSGPRYHADSSASQNLSEMNPTLAERFSRSNENISDLGYQFAQARDGRYLTKVLDYMKAAKIAPDNDERWCHLQEVPSSEEICPFLGSENLEDEPLPKNVIDGPWPSKEVYLGAQYRLLREDSIRPLCDAVEAVARMPEGLESDFDKSNDLGVDMNIGKSIGIYERVTPVAVVYAPARGVAVRVVFSLRRVGKRITWAQSKRLISGSVVALTPANDCFRTRCIIAVVAARPIEQLAEHPPAIDLTFPRADEMCFDMNEEMLMVENRSAYFEADRHTMMALQKLMNEPFPLREHIVDLQKHVEPPEYIIEDPHLSLSAAAKVAISDMDKYEQLNVLTSWPKEDVFGMDASQQSGLHRMLTKRVAILQGPPGTGKTFVSVVALFIMMRQLRAGDPPIIVACQTNHALDQILRKVAEIEPDSFIRLGGRSQDQDIVRKRTLYEVRQKTGRSGGCPGGLMHDMKNLERKMREVLSVLEPPRTPGETAEPFSLHRLKELNLISYDQYESLLEDDPKYNHTKDTGDEPRFLLWAGSQLRQVVSATDRIDESILPHEEIDLEAEEIQEREAEFQAKDDEREIDALRGITQYTTNNWTADIDNDVFANELAEAELAKNKNLWSIRKCNRGLVYNYLQRRGKEKLFAEVRLLAAKYNEVAQVRKAHYWQADAELLKQVKLVGVTTTGISKYRALLTAIHPKTVLIEEAAETLEAPVTAGCLESVEHLILVGDHKQLRPHCNLRKLESDRYNFNISLFERLVDNGVEFDTLRMQRRMIPEIRRILDPIYGRNFITDHPDLSAPEIRPSVPGMGDCKLFFFTHEYEESRDEMQSCKNDFEADMILGFFRYLLMNGTPVERITCLTFYNAQRRLIQRKLSRNLLEDRQNANVVTVDSYQGEENDVIILSLVRNNSNGSVGFLNVENRVCVALSRARRGLYMFGRGELLAGESRLWSQVIELLFHQINKTWNTRITGPNRRIGYNLPLQCTKHHKKIYVEEVPDWDGIDGGCRRKCPNILSCGHGCRLNCHDYPCDELKCLAECNAVLACGHRCLESCGNLHICQVCPPVGTKLDTSPKKSFKRYQRSAKQRIQAFSESNSTDPTSWQNFAQGGAKEEDLARERAAQEHRRQNPVSAGAYQIRDERGHLVGNYPDLDLPSAPLSPISRRQNTCTTPSRRKEVHLWSRNRLSEQPKNSLVLDDPFAGPSTASEQKLTGLASNVSSALSHKSQDIAKRDLTYRRNTTTLKNPTLIKSFSPRPVPPIPSGPQMGSYSAAPIPLAPARSQPVTAYFPSRPKASHSRTDEYGREFQIRYHDEFPPLMGGKHFEAQPPRSQQLNRPPAVVNIKHGRVHSKKHKKGRSRLGSDLQDDFTSRLEQGRGHTPTPQPNNQLALSIALHPDLLDLDPCDLPPCSPKPEFAQPWLENEGPPMGDLIDLD